MKAPNGHRGVVREQALCLLPDLAPWEYESLKASIRRFGVILPVVKDEFGSVIDGHQRERACRELGVENYPVLTLRGLTEEEKRDHAHVLNLVRRRLNRRQMRALIAAELKRTPDLSNNWLAQTLGTTDKTVEAVRQEMIATSEIPKFDRHRGKDGKSRKVTRIVTHSDRDAERAQEALSILGDEAPTRPMDLRLLERAANRKKKLEELAARPIVPLGDDAVRLYHCPFQRLEEVAGIEPGSVNLILTDIPYGRGFLPEVDALGAFAARVLAPGGLLVTYCGQMYLNQVIRLLEDHLVWGWPAASVWDGDGNIIYPRNVTSKWMPVLVYSQGEWMERRRWQDLSIVDRKEKEWHDWQQPLAEIEWFVRFFSEQGDLVVDPCGGGFTTAVACKNLGRRCISCDIDEASVIGGQMRLAEMQQGMGHAG